MLNVVKTAMIYFAIVFMAGFLLGTLRTIFVVPRIGERWAELSEMPIMLVVILAANWTIFRRSSFTTTQCLWIGGFALMCMLGAEILLVVTLRDITIAEYLTQRDPVAGLVYAFMLCLFALLPAISSLGKTFPFR